MSLKRPPDKYRTIKLPLKAIQWHNLDYSAIDSAVTRMNELTILVYQFLRAFVIYSFENSHELPTLSEGSIKMVYKLFINESSGPKPKGENKEMLNRYEQFFNTIFAEYLPTDFKKIDGSHLSRVVDYSCTDILTNIKNNIKCHFVNHIKGFVNRMFKAQNANLTEGLKGKEKKHKMDELNKHLFDIKQDLLNDTLNSDPRYHDWIKEYRYQVLPKSYGTSYYYDITSDPLKYLKYMYQMVEILEKNDHKLFQFFPLRTEVVPKYIMLDTKSIIELFIKTDKKKYLNNISHFNDLIWWQYFNTDNKAFKMKDYEFDNCISTDGYAVSIRFIHQSFMEEEQQKKENMKKARELYRNMTKEEITEFKETKRNKAKEKAKLTRLQEKEEYSKLSKGEKKQYLENKKKAKYVEFPYLDELSDQELDELRNSKWVVVDPGKRTLLYMMNNEGKIFKYNNSDRITATKRLKYQTFRENQKAYLEISNIEQELNSYKSKTVNLREFLEYIRKKTDVNGRLFAKYWNEYFRKLRWFSHINNKRADDILLNKIENVFGKNVKIIMGDWQIGKQMRNFISTPNISLKRKIANRFDVYNLDEFRTSCLHHKTETYCKNMYTVDKDGDAKKLHAVLTCQMENNRSACINRDRNSVLNMIKLVRHYLKTGERLYRYRRDVKLEETEKVKAVTALSKEEPPTTVLAGRTADGTTKKCIYRRKNQKKAEHAAIL